MEGAFENQKWDMRILWENDDWNARTVVVAFLLTYKQTSTDLH